MCQRCSWAGVDPIYINYHDNEWGVPVHDDTKWFEFILLDGAQAGLSWITILKKRENYRRAFDGFDVRKIAEYSDEKVENLLLDSGIIRNRRKIEAAITNARAFIKIQEEFGSFDNYIWRFVDGRPVINCWKELSEVPVTTGTSDIMSKDLMKRGFKFVGSTICYSFMQAAGMVNDHLMICFRYKEINNLILAESNLKED
ncbi:MAG: DNA-3-methyladenine glycosylase I [Bacillota bacterium]